MAGKPRTIDEYPAALSDDKRAALEKLGKTIRAAVSNADVSTFPRFRLRLRQGRRFVGPAERDGPVRSPRVRLAIDVKRPRKEFDFVAEEIECHGAGKVGEVLEFHLAEGNRLLRDIKKDHARRVCKGLAGKDNLQVRDFQLRLVDEDGRCAGRPAGERDLPRPPSRPQVLVEREAAEVQRQRQQ